MFDFQKAVGFGYLNHKVFKRLTDTVQVGQVQSPVKELVRAGTFLPTYIVCQLTHFKEKCEVLAFSV